MIVLSVYFIIYLFKKWVFWTQVGLKIHKKTNPVLFLHIIILQMSTCEVVSVAIMQNSNMPNEPESFPLIVVPFSNSVFARCSTNEVQSEVDCWNQMFSVFRYVISLSALSSTHIYNQTKTWQKHNQNHCCLLKSNKISSRIIKWH